MQLKSPETEGYAGLRFVLKSYALVGLAMFLAGLIFAVGFWSRDQATLLAALAGVALGVFLMFLRQGVTLRPDRRLVDRWWRALIPIHRTSFPLGDCQFVEIVTELRYQGKSADTYFIVRLPLDNPLELGAFPDHAAARARAKEVARALELGLEDATSGERITRDAGTLDQPLVERVADEHLDPPLPPESSPIQCLIQSESILVTIPSRGVTAHSLALAILCCIAALGIGGWATWVAIERLSVSTAPGLETVGGAVLILAVLVGLPAANLVSALEEQSLLLGTETLEVFYRRRIGSTTIALRWSEVEDVQVTASSHLPKQRGAPPPDALVVHHCSKTTEIAAGRSWEELQWLKNLLLYVMSRA